MQFPTALKHSLPLHDFMDTSKYTSEQISRFWSKVDKRGPDDCWEWRGAKNSKGYGQIRLWNVAIFTHRLAYALTKGHIPRNMLVCHTCDNRLCCNPDHLFLGTPADNTADMMRKHRNKSADGEKSGTARFTNKQADEIRRIYASGGVSHRELAKRYGVAHAVIGKIVRRQTYR